MLSNALVDSLCPGWLQTFTLLRTIGTYTVICLHDADENFATKFSL